jgi:phospholipid-binding lipoprotein MlaA
MNLLVHRISPVFIAICVTAGLAGCATTKANLAPEVPAMHSVSEIEDETLSVVHDDPWVGFNKSMYKFNYNFDKYFFIPVVNTYEFLLPTFAQTGVSNFFNNIAEVRTLYNSLLQAKGKKAATTTGRLLTNTTIGIGGLFDPATKFGMARQNEDFGQTLGVWGVPEGPYFVMPVLGPGTVRSATGFAVDSTAHYMIKSAIDPHENLGIPNEVLTGITVLKAIDNRHQQPFRYWDSGYPFEYELVHFLFQQKRKMDTMK